MKKFEFFSTIYAFSFVFFLFGASETAASEEETIYKSIISENSLFRKQELGTKLGKLGKKADVFIGRLTQDDHYWNRIGGVYALAEQDTDKSREKMIVLYASDFMVEYEIFNFVSKDPKKYQDAVLRTFKAEKKDSRKKLLKLFGKKSYPPAVKVLKEEIDSKKSALRLDAFKVLSSQDSDQDQYLRSFLEDKTLRTAVLEYILQKGKKSDKEYMNGILKNSKSPAEEQIIALRFLKNFGEFEEQKAAYQKILSDSGNADTLLLYSMTDFREFRSEEIRKNLCKYAQKGRIQPVRILAAENLIPYQDKKNEKCIEKIADEPFETVKRELNAFEILITLGTLGFSEILRNVEENNSRERFAVRQKAVKEHLSFLSRMKEN